MELVPTQKIRLPIISMKMSLIISERKTDLLIPVTSTYLIMQFGTSCKKILYKNPKRYEDIKRLSAAMSNAWDRMTKKFINNSIDQWRMRLEKAVEEGSGHIVHLI